MPKDIFVHTRKIEKKTSLSWKIDDFLDAISLHESCIAGPNVTVATQPQTTWKTFVVEHRYKSFVSYMFKLEPCTPCVFEKKMKAELELSVLDTKGNFLQKENSAICINSCQFAKSISFAYSLEGTECMGGISKLLVNNALNMQCCFRVIEYSNDYNETSPVSSENDLNCLSTNLGTLYSSKALSDFAIVVKDKVFHVHKCILSSRSCVFGAMFKHHTSESRNSVLLIEDCDVDTMEKFLLYIYTDQLDELPLEKYLHLYSVSDKYEIESLKKTCAHKLFNSISTDNVFEVYTLGYYHSDQYLKSAAITYINKNIPSILTTERWAAMISHNSHIASKMLEESAIF